MRSDCTVNGICPIHWIKRIFVVTNSTALIILLQTISSYHPKESRSNIDELDGPSRNQEAKRA
jgi:hypothetical protein